MNTIIENTKHTHTFIYIDDYINEVNINFQKFKVYRHVKKYHCLVFKNSVTLFVNSVIHEVHL